MKRGIGGRRKAVSVIGITALVAAIAAVSFAAMGSRAASPSIADGEYTLTLSSSNAFDDPSSGSGSADTTSGNSIPFSCSGASASDGAFIALAASGSFANTMAISGITSITASSDQALTLTYWWSVTSESLALTADLAADGTVSFSENRPSYFRVTATADTVIASLTIKYTCAAEYGPGDITDTEPSNCTIEYDSETGTYKVSGHTADDITSAHIPAYYNDGTHGKRPVTAVGDSAFFYCASLTSVDIPSTITTIEGGSFYECGLTGIDLPDSVVTIGNAAFLHCLGLVDVRLPESVVTIGNGAFDDCSSLRSINIPSTVTSIGFAAFYGCYSLESITIPSSVTSIGDGIFHSCSNLASVTFESPCSLTSFGVSAFMQCSKLTAIDIPTSITSIGEQAFNSCTKLAEITYAGTPDQWAAIEQGSQAFDGVIAEYAICTGGDGGQGTLKKD